MKHVTRKKLNPAVLFLSHCVLFCFIWFSILPSHKNDCQLQSTGAAPSRANSRCRLVTSSASCVFDEPENKKGKYPDDFFPVYNPHWPKLFVSVSPPTVL